MTLGEPKGRSVSSGHIASDQSKTEKNNNPDERNDVCTKDEKNLDPILKKLIPEENGDNRADDTSRGEEGENDFFPLWRHFFPSE
ncbi:MAG: hypothetical protein WAO55_06055 [Candidatus Manganitrophaceae bacterium]